MTYSSGKRETLWETRELQLFAITAKSKDTGEGIAKSLSIGDALCQLTSLFKAFLIPRDGTLRTYRVFSPESFWRNRFTYLNLLSFVWVL